MKRNAVLKTMCLILLMGALSTLLWGCGGIPDASELMEAVKLPEVYRITYSVETPEGVVRTVTKTVDGEGNVYFASGETGSLFLKSGDRYECYVSAEDGRFTKTSDSYTADYVEQATREFLQYAERSMQQFLPGAEKQGKQTVLGRSCTVYCVGVSGEAGHVTYSIYVDDETGVCLRFDEEKRLGGAELEADGEVFVCIEFVTDEVESLRETFDF